MLLLGGTVLGAGDTTRNTADMVSALTKLSVLWKWQAQSKETN